MIVSKNSFQIVELTKSDNKVPVLDNICIEDNGTAVASNGKCILLVSPVKADTKKRLKNILDEHPSDGVIVSSETVKHVLKDLPADRQFGGLLEHCDVERIGQDCHIRFTDGKRRRSLVGKCYPRQYIPYRDIVGPVLKTSNETNKNVRIVLNLRRLILLLGVIEKICPDTTGESPIWLEFTGDGNVIIRGINNINGQRCIGFMTSYKGIEGRWLVADEWEESYSIHKKKILHKTKK